MKNSIKIIKNSSFSKLEELSNLLLVTLDLEGASIVNIQYIDAPDEYVVLIWYCFK